MDLLLLSSSRLSGGAPLDYARDHIAELLGDCRRLHFAPYALADRDGYTGQVRQALEPLGVRVFGLHETGDPRAALETAEAVFVGGGNTFRLLRTFQRLDLLDLVRERVRAGGLRYLGASAGSNLVCPTIRTTNDMPIVEPAGLGALGLLPFQLNPHYLDPSPQSEHMGETRDQRLLEFLEDNAVPVLGLREGAALRLHDATLSLVGRAGARLFQRHAPPTDYTPGADLTWLMATRPQFDTA